MTKTKIKEIIKSAIEGVNVVNAYFRFAAYYYNLIPLAYNERLFLAVNEDDFIFDGYSIFRFKDLKKVKVKTDMCDLILKNEGLTAKISIPEVDISSWQSIFESLQRMNKNIIVEKQRIDLKESEFYIGRIERVYKHFFYLRHFDADGVWDEQPTKINYSEITNVVFDSRYVNIFSKYLSEPPALAEKLSVK